MWIPLRRGLTAGLAMLALGIEMNTMEAEAQLVSVPHTASGITLDVGSETFEVDIDLTTLPSRPRVRAVASPDAGHADMVLDLEIVECDPHEFFFEFVPSNPPWQPGEPCPYDWSSSQAPGDAEALAELWACNPDPDAGPPIDQCTVRVTAANFGSGGAPATIDLTITGETKPVTGTLHTAIDTGTSTTSSGDIGFDKVLFIQDGDDFRWIYDDDADDIVETYESDEITLRGTCEVENFPEPFTLPYTYTYLGDPGYSGYDCCTWQLDSVTTGTTGSGQALFYINIGFNPPPPDTDADGFFDPCDNCVAVPNGPFLGTCVQPDGTTDFTTCLSDQECGAGEFCSMAQEDDDFDRSQGLVCVPEPGRLPMLCAGLLGLGLLARRRDRRVLGCPAR